MLFDQYERALPGFTDFVGYSYDPSGSKCGPLGNCFTESSPPAVPDLRRRPQHEAPARRRVDGRLRTRAWARTSGCPSPGSGAQDKNIQGSVYPDARWTPTTVTNGLTDQPLTVYQWANQSASEADAAATRTPTASSTSTSNGNVLGTARAERKYKGLMFVARQALQQPLAGPHLLRAVEDRGHDQQHRRQHLRPDDPSETPTNALVNTFGEAGQRPHPRAEGLRHLADPEGGGGPERVLPFPERANLDAVPALQLARHQLPAVVGAPAVPGAVRQQPASRRESYLDLRLEKIFKIGRGPVQRLRRHPERPQREHHHRRERPLPAGVDLRLRPAGRVRKPDLDRRPAQGHPRSAVELLI